MDRISPEAKLMQAIFGERIDEPDEQFYETVDGVSLKEALDDALNSSINGAAFTSQQMRDRAKYIMIRRFGWTGEPCQTLEVVGKSCGVSRERVRQMEGKVLRCLRHPSRSRPLKRYFRQEKIEGDEQNGYGTGG